MVETVELVNNHTAEVAASSRYTWERLAVVKRDSYDLSQPLLLPWQASSSSAFPKGSWDYFSATCWFKACNLADALGPDFPIGFVDSAVGGTPIEMWLPGCCTVQ